jgi:hypothetical protein
MGEPYEVSPISEREISRISEEKPMGGKDSFSRTTSISGGRGIMLGRTNNRT